MNKKIIIGITGASGVIYGIEILKELNKKRIWRPILLFQILVKKILPLKQIIL